MRFVFALLLAAIAAPADAAIVNVTLRDFRFTPNDLTINVGDTVHFVNNQGFHNVVADDGAYSSGNPANAPWTFDHTFSSPGVFRVYCAVHSGPGQDITTAMNARITVNGTAPPPAFSINQGISGAWFNPSTPGQGFLIDVRPSDKFIFVAWFTYEAESPTTADGAKVGSNDQRWLTAQGNYTGAGGQLTLFNTTGGAFNGTRATTTTQVGTLNVNFTSCTAGTFQYTLPNNVSGQIGVQRVLPGTESLCQQLSP
jgi:plastocyanin